MMILTCDGCRRRIAEDDPDAVRRMPLGATGDGGLIDWCGSCLAIIRAELPRLAAEAGRAQQYEATEAARRRALHVQLPVRVLERHDMTNPYTTGS